MCHFAAQILVSNQSTVYVVQLCICMASTPTGNNINYKIYPWGRKKKEGTTHCKQCLCVSPVHFARDLPNIILNRTVSSAKALTCMCTAYMPPILPVVFKVPFFSLQLQIILCDGGILSLSERDEVRHKNWLGNSHKGNQRMCMPSGSPTSPLSQQVATGFALANATQRRRALSITESCASHSFLSVQSRREGLAASIYLPTRTTEIYPFHTIFF